MLEIEKVLKRSLFCRLENGGKEKCSNLPQDPIACNKAQRKT